MRCGWRGAGWIEEALHEDKVEPAAEFVTDLAKVSDPLKPQPLVKSDRGIVCRVDPADHHMLSKRKSTRKEGLDKGSPDGGAATVLSHMDGVLDRVAISGHAPRHSLN